MNPFFGQSGQVQPPVQLQQRTGTSMANNFPVGLPTHLATLEQQHHRHQARYGDRFVQQSQPIPRRHTHQQPLLGLEVQMQWVRTTTGISIGSPQRPTRRNDGGVRKSKGKRKLPNNIRLQIRRKRRRSHVHSFEPPRPPTPAPWLREGHGHSFITPPPPQPPTPAPFGPPIARNSFEVYPFGPDIHRRGGWPGFGGKTHANTGEAMEIEMLGLAEPRPAATEQLQQWQDELFERQEVNEEVVEMVRAVEQMMRD